MRTDLLSAQQTLQQTQAAKHRDSSTFEKELHRLREINASETSRAEMLSARVEELEAAVPASKNAELVENLRRTQEDLLKQLTALRGEGGFGAGLEAPALPEIPEASSFVTVGGDGLGELHRRENDELRAQIRALELQLDERQLAPTGSAPGTAGSAGGGAPEGSNVQVLQMKVRELDLELAKLEKEHAAALSRAAYAEQQLETMDETLKETVARYQKEIMRMRAGGG